MPLHPRFPLRQISLLLISMFLLVLPVPVAAQDAWEHREPQVVIEGIDYATDLEFGRDGYVYYTLLRDREIHRASLETQEVDEDFVVEFPDANWEQSGELGLYSLALDEEFHENGMLYVSYSGKDGDDRINVLSRVTLLDESGAAHEEVLLTRPGGQFHNGGRVMIADGYLWWTTGDTLHWEEDSNEDARSQEDGVLIGKVLRLTLDAEPAEGNPWGDHAFTKGHRNVFGIAWDPEEEHAFITENADGGNDYVQILTPGGNYGWPNCEGYCDPPRDEYEDPVWQADEHVAPTGATWFRGAFWWGSFNQGDIYRTWEEGGEWMTEKIYHYPGSEAGRPLVLGLTTGPDEKSLWFTTMGEIVTMRFDDHEQWPAQEPREEGPYWWERDDRDLPEDPPSDDDAQGAIPGASVPVLLLLIGGASLVLGDRRRHKRFDGPKD